MKPHKKIVSGSFLKVYSLNKRSSCFNYVPSVNSNSLFEMDSFRGLGSLPKTPWYFGLKGVPMWVD